MTGRLFFHAFSHLPPSVEIGWVGWVAETFIVALSVRLIVLVRSAPRRSGFRRAAALRGSHQL
ncbi:hypothetical protein [Sphingomonas sp. S2M10]|uniref:hypothetical protein n=1 Tax=Sphingomonas sp. S2M10 TaxID=2705010 RepID=UPI001457126C|nr:hypothetical protein [Sphingomonas sp. S2M10]